MKFGRAVVRHLQLRFSSSLIFYQFSFRILWCGRVCEAVRENKNNNKQVLGNVNVESMPLAGYIHLTAIYTHWHLFAAATQHNLGHSVRAVCEKSKFIQLMLLICLSNYSWNLNKKKKFNYGRFDLLTTTLMNASYELHLLYGNGP